MSLVLEILTYSRNKKQRSFSRELILQAKQEELNRYDDEYKTLPILMAGETGNTEACEALLKRGVSVDAYHPWTLQTALIEACTFNHLNTAKFLIENGANINHTDDRGFYTALHWAAGKGNEKIVSLLLEHKADTTKLTSTGESAFDIAKALKKKKVIQVFEKENI